MVSLAVLDRSTNSFRLHTDMEKNVIHLVPIELLVYFVFYME